MNSDGREALGPHEARSQPVIGLGAAALEAAILAFPDEVEARLAQAAAWRAELETADYGDDPIETER